MNETYVKIIVTLMGALVIGVSSFVVTNVIELTREQAVLEKELNQKRGEVFAALEDAQQRIARSNHRIDKIVDKMMELHPMQASSMAWFLSHNNQAQCRDDFDCPDGQVCLDGACEDL